ncbi:hypothetical protein E4U53_000554 [Claviceps sorghi]|nr:hypothetical protein E4U53_000554 [Claviceps sorghi]
MELFKHLTVFGLSGIRQCPERYRGLTTSLTVLADIMVELEVNPKHHADFLKRVLTPGLSALVRDPG